ncbi:MAG TPA: hypothetical protein PLE30_02330 [Candidatus Kapabacteria bacterium]|nr:hypothetical protein [Candidatus Kapabacteria bacterium]
MDNIITLTSFDLKRFWTIKRLIIMGIFALITIAVSFIPSSLNIPKSSTQVNFDVILASGLSFVVPVLVLLFTGGIISNDIRTFYYRTILSRPVSKEEYLCSKYLFSFINLFLGTILFAIVPSFIGITSLPVEINFNFGTSLLVYLLYLLEGVLFISISMSLSTILKGSFNIFVLIIWIFLETTLINGLLSNFVSFSKPLAIFSDFFFPAGFSEAAKLLNTSSVLLFESILWGFAALTFWFALSFYQITKIKIDANMD